MKTLRAAIPFVLCAALLAAVRAENPAAPAAVKKPWTDKEKKAVQALIERYVKAKPEERPDLLKEAAALEPPADEMKRLVPAIFNAIAAFGTKSDGKAENHSKEHGARYLLQNQAKGKGPQPVPLFIGLHGGGKGVGDAGSSAQQWSIAVSKGAVCVFPQVIETADEGEWNKENEQQYLLALIEELKHTYVIDTNRIYCAGHSMGGYGTWGMGGYHSDSFAAVASGAGGIRAVVEGGKVTRTELGALENFLNLPIWFFHGTNDPQVPVEPDRYADEKMKEWGYEHTYKEYPGIGHGFPPEGVKPIVDWLFTKTRITLPRKIVWYPARKYRTSYYWLGVVKPVGLPALPARIEAARDGNRIDLTCKAALIEIHVWLNEKMVDFKKPVVITLNGTEKFNGPVTPNFADTLESIVERNDNNLWFPVKVKLY